MKAMDKITKRTHAACPVLCGYQVCLIPDLEWDDASLSDIHVFTTNQFNDRFELF